MRKGRVLTNIQGLRALAAFMVVFYHARLMTPIGTTIPFEFGNAGVDIFFYISGFIIAHVSRGADVGRPGHFLIKRIVRIGPLYWLFTLLLAAVAQKMPALAGAGGQPTLPMTLQSLFFVPYYDGSGQIHPVLFMGWTLNYEMFFYLSFALALLIRAETIRIAAISLALVCLTLVGAAVRPESAVAITYTDPMMLEFVGGLWMSWLYHRVPQRPIGTAATVLLLTTALAGFALLVAGDYLWPHVPRGFKWGLPALAIFASVLALQHGGRTVDGWLLLLFGEASYSIYLIHPFVIKAATMVYGHLHIAAMPLHVAALVALYALVGVVGLAVHLLIERPLVARLRTLGGARIPPSIVTAVALHSD